MFYTNQQHMRMVFKCTKLYVTCHMQKHSFYPPNLGLRGTEVYSIHSFSIYISSYNIYFIQHLHKLM